jgi:GNAT superfamily N-acetyltransferase
MASATSTRRIPMIVTFLEMTAKPAAIPPPLPRGKIAYLRSEHPPVHFYRYLYDTVGGKYFWVDRKKIDDAKLADIIGDPDNHLYVLYTEGTPAGMAELDFRAEGAANIAYFGLTPEATGRRLGYFFLYQACMSAWTRPISKLLVNTCTLDHPRALPLYQRMGFKPYAREERFVELP